jgi:choline-glycine betaine transporter
MAMVFFSSIHWLWNIRLREAPGKAFCEMTVASFVSQEWLIFYFFLVLMHVIIICGTIACGRTGSCQHGKENEGGKYNHYFFHNLQTIIEVCTKKGRFYQNNKNLPDLLFKCRKL